MMSLFNKQKTSQLAGNTFNKPQEIPQVLEGNAEVGYSFASNNFETSNLVTDNTINHIQEIKSEVPSIMVHQEEEE